MCSYNDVWNCDQGKFQEERGLKRMRVPLKTKGGSLENKTQLICEQADGKNIF